MSSRRLVVLSQPAPTPARGMRPFIDLLTHSGGPTSVAARYFHCPGGNDDEHSTATLGRPLRGIGRRRSRRSRRQSPGAVAGRGLTGASRSRRTRMAFENPPTKKIGMTCSIQVARPQARLMPDGVVDEDVRP